MKLINYFNGKKTSIGAVLLFFVAVPHLESYISIDIIDIITYVGMTLTGVGLAHKGNKAIKAKG